MLDYIRRNAAHIAKVDRFPDIRRRSAVELAERCSYQAAHTEQVTRLALAIFDQTGPIHGLAAREREWLEFAGLLHDIGTHISHEDHHRHSEYLIKHGDLRGFDPEEIQVLALVARYHRTGRPKKSNRDYAKLHGDAKRAVKVLSAILCIAEGLDRSHADVISGIEAITSGDELTLKLQTRGDSELEVWAAARNLPALERVLERSIRLEMPASTTPALVG